MPKSQFFRVATEGATTDGRNIDRATIEQIAATYNPKTYGARIWLEHIRGTRRASGARNSRERMDGSSGRRRPCSERFAPPNT